MTKQGNENRAKRGHRSVSVAVAVVAELGQQQQEQVWSSVVTRNQRIVGDAAEVDGLSQEHD